jgi:hypothetical protein
LVKAAWRRQGQGGADTGPMFVKAQWAAASEAAEALAQMAARGAKGDVKLASLVRERQDLLAEWQKRDAARMAAASIAPDQRNRQAEAVNVARIGAIEHRPDRHGAQGWLPRLRGAGERGGGLDR